MVTRILSQIFMSSSLCHLSNLLVRPKGKMKKSSIRCLSHRVSYCGRWVVFWRPVQLRSEGTLRTTFFSSISGDASWISANLEWIHSFCIDLVSALLQQPHGCKWPLWLNKRTADDNSKNWDAEILLILGTAILGVLTSHCYNGRASGSRDGADALWLGRMTG